MNCLQQNNSIQMSYNLPWRTRAVFPGYFIHLFSVFFSSKILIIDFKLKYSIWVWMVWNVLWTLFARSNSFIWKWLWITSADAHLMNVYILKMIGFNVHSFAALLLFMGFFLHLVVEYCILFSWMLNIVLFCFRHSSTNNSCNSKYKTKSIFSIRIETIYIFRH